MDHGGGPRQRGGHVQTGVIKLALSDERQRLEAEGAHGREAAAQPGAEEKAEVGSDVERPLPRGEEKAQRKLPSRFTARVP